jgi:hypothetical protein
VTPKLLPFIVRASIKAAIVLQPLLGITNFLQIVNSPYGVSENMSNNVSLQLLGFCRALRTPVFQLFNIQKLR